mmetsp:Transcript_28821/g.49042  ORF Transcript_28821/g.49042 Transcript_28821/m.49042 type:complete len:226 (-) Transcript_28821:797-1474(-)
MEDHADAALSMETDALVLLPCMGDLAVAAVDDAACMEIVDAVASAEIADYKEIDAVDMENVERAAAAAADVVASEMDQAVVAPVASPFYTVNENHPFYTVNAHNYSHHHELHSAFDERSHQSNCQVDLHASCAAVVFVKHLSFHYYFQHLFSHYYHQQHHHLQQYRQTKALQSLKTIASTMISTPKSYHPNYSMPQSMDHHNTIPTTLHLPLLQNLSLVAMTVAC